MTVKKYGNVKKSIVILCQMVFVVTLVVSVYVLLITFDKNMFSSNDEEQNDYYKTEYFRNEATKEIKNLLYYIQLRSNFETNGNYNESKKVNIKNYIESDMINDELGDHVTYYLKDLLEWKSLGVGEEDVTLSDRSGNPVRIKGAIVERFKTVEGKTLKELYSEGVIESSEEYFKYCNYLANTINVISEDFYRYKEETNRYKSTNSNISYTVVIGHQFFSNMEFEGLVTVENLKQRLLEQKIYLYMNSSNLAFESSFSNIQNEMNYYLGSLKSFARNNYAILIEIDSNFSKNDALQNAYSRYQSIKPWFWTCVVLGLFSILGLIVSFTYLTMVAGYRDSNKELYLTFFDRLYTEVALALGLLIGTLVIYEAYVFMRSNNDREPFMNIAVLALVSMLIDGIFLVEYLSLVRRARAKTLTSNSLYNAVTTPVRTAIGSKAIALRVFLSYAIFIGVFLLLSYLGFYYKSAVALILLAVLILFAGTILVRNSLYRKRVIDGAARIADGDLDFKIDTEGLKSDNLVIATIINEAGAGISHSLEEQIRTEKLQADLITNVSHDIKTPLTSIINYVDLLKREKLDNPRVEGYIKVLDEKSMRLKHLTEDLVEASKISSGNIEINLTEIDFNELINQTTGEFLDKFEEKNIQLNTNLCDNPVYIMADGMRIWRVIENLYNNAVKYALPGTRVYVNLTVVNGVAEMVIKNVSAQALNINADELTERFIRGDISRSTEGSGLGLSIAKNLTKLQGGSFDVYVDGDLFKVTVAFSTVKHSSCLDEADE